MRSALKPLMLALVAAAGCQEQPAEDQNIVITNEIPANADIETLPADESTGTPTDQLENGSDNADLADLNEPSNGY